MDTILLLKVSGLLGATLLAARLLCRAPAITRHRVWTVAFACLLALPLLTSTLPSLYVPAPAWLGTTMPLRTLPKTAAETASIARSPAVERSNDLGAGPGLGASIAPTTEIRSTGQAEHLRSAFTFDWATVPSLLLAVWFIGTAAAATTLLVSLLRVLRLARAAEHVADAEWQSAAHTLARRLGLRRPARLLASSRVSAPMAGGIWRPVVFLPAAALTWTAECRDVVLAHEIAHLARRDPLRHLVVRLAVALYWFNPLVWIAARQATAAREHACDDAVLALGTRPSAYARVLLDLAESMQTAAPALEALPMVERSLLEARVMTILNDDLPPANRRRVGIPATGLVLLTLSVAAARPAATDSAARIAAVTTLTEPMPGSASNPSEVPATKAEGGAETLALSAEAQDVPRDSACWWDELDGVSFSGQISTSNRGGRTVIREQIGTRGTDRVIQQTLGDVRVCMLAEDAGDRADSERPSQWVDRARRVVLETRRGNTVQRLETGRDAGGSQRTSWRVGSAERPLDAAARQWRDRMLAVLDTTWELATLRGQVSSLRGQISSIHGQRSSLRGEISSLRGEISSMRGRMSSVRGEESSLRGRISSIQGHVGSLRGAISSERGAISSVTASRYGATDAERAQILARIKRHDDEIARIEREIRDYGEDARVAAVEREIAALDADAKVAAIEKEIRAFDLDGKVAAIERQIADLDVERKVAAIERQIDALHAERRGRQLEERRDSEVKQLESAIGAIR
jgi:beta-lactamase regulating signal transducer with metallopeptidase domain/predicted  nucleic acid-binding Zn-ribbon protein